MEMKTSVYKLFFKNAGILLLGCYENISFIELSMNVSLFKIFHQMIDLHKIYN